MEQNIGESYWWMARILETFIYFFYRVPVLSILFSFFVFIAIHAALETVNLYVTGRRPPGVTDFVTRSQNSKERGPCVALINYTSLLTNKMSSQHERQMEVCRMPAILKI